MTKEELEKEATEYALEWGDKTDGTYACCRDGYLASAEPREKCIEELIEENTRLKKANEKLENENGKLKDYRLCTLKEQQTGLQKYALNLEHKLSWYDERLTKAKEIILKLSTCLEGHSNNNFEYELLQKAEQFLKEEHNEV